MGEQRISVKGASVNQRSDMQCPPGAPYSVDRNESSSSISARREDEELALVLGHEEGDTVGGRLSIGSDDASASLRTRIEEQRGEEHLAENYVDKVDHMEDTRPLIYGNPCTLCFLCLQFMCDCCDFQSHATTTRIEMETTRRSSRDYGNI